MFLGQTYHSLFDLMTYLRDRKRLGCFIASRCIFLKIENNKSISGQSSEEFLPQNTKDARDFRDYQKVKSFWVILVMGVLCSHVLGYAMQVNQGHLGTDPPPPSPRASAPTATSPAGVGPFCKGVTGRLWIDLLQANDRLKWGVLI